MAVVPVVTVSKKTVAGAQRIRQGFMTSGAADTYATNGFTVAASTFGLTRLHHLEVSNASPVAGATAMAPRWDRANGKVLLYETGAAVSTPLDQVGNAEAVASYVINFAAYGK